MTITRGFGFTTDLTTGWARKWVMGRDGVKKWAGDGEPCGENPPAEPYTPSVEELEALWDASPRPNTWVELGLDEIVAFAQVVERRKHLEEVTRLRGAMMKALDMASAWEWSKSSEGPADAVLLACSEILEDALANRDTAT